MKIWSFLTPLLILSCFLLIGHFLLGGKEGGYDIYEAFSGIFLLSVIYFMCDSY